MAIDLNADVGKIFKDMMGGKPKGAGARGATDNAPEKKSSMYKDAILKVVIILCVAVSTIYGISVYSADPIKKDESEFATNELLQDAFNTLNTNINSSRQIFISNKEKVTAILPDFSEVGDSKDLFNLISNLGGENNMVIKNISKGKSSDINKPIRYIQNTVFLEIEGSYRNFINFKKNLSKNKTIVNINREAVKLKKDKYGDRKLNISLVLSDFSIEKEEYEKLLSKNL